MDNNSTSPISTNLRSPLTFTHWTQNKETTTHNVGNPFPGLDRHKNMVGLNWLMGLQHSPLDNWISNGNTYTGKHNKRKKNCTDSLPLKKTTYYICVTKKMNDNKNMDSTISRPVYTVKPVIKGTSISQITVFKKAVSFFPLRNIAYNFNLYIKCNCS